MGDYESRDRGYQGNNNGGNRKRRYQDDGPNHRNDDHSSYNRRPHHHYNNNNGRRRFDPPGTRLRKRLLQSFLDNTLHSPEEEIRDISGLVTSHAEDEYVRDTFCDSVTSVCLEQPCKIPFLAALVLVVNGKSKDLVGDLVQKLGGLLELSIKAGEWIAVKLLLRFLACLGDVVEGGVVGLLEELFERAVDLQSADPEETLGPELVKIILFTIPYIMVATPTSATKEKIEQLLQKTDIVASTPHALESLADPYPTDDQDAKPMACLSLLSMLQRQLQDEAASDWPLTCLPKISKIASGVKGSTEKGDEEAKTNDDIDMNDDGSQERHPFPTVTLPQTVNPGERLLFPQIYYSVFADQEVESVPPTSSIASTLIRDSIVDTINLVDYNRTFVGKFIIELDNYWAPDTFVKRATPFDKLRDITAENPKWKPEDMAIDAVFSQMLQLPSPHHKPAYYHSVIMEACKLAPSAIAPSLGRAIRFSFRSLPVMDLELVYRFTDWFAHHVSNFEFRWKWVEWAPEIELPNSHPKKAFIRNVIDKEIRLSFPKRIADSLPPDFAAMIEKGQYNDEPDFKYSSSSTPFAQQGQAVLGLLKDKSSSSEQIQSSLDDIHQSANSQGLDGSVISTDILMTSICHIGSKSLSHVLSSIEKNRERLLAIGPTSEAARQQIITSVMEYWSYHSGQAVNIVDKLLNYTIVTPQSVIEWALSPTSTPSSSFSSTTPLSNPAVFEMIWLTMTKVAKRISDICRARANPDLLSSTSTSTEEGQAHINVIEETLVRERDGMRSLLTLILSRVRDLSSTSPSNNSEQDLIQLWARKWEKVYTRKQTVEEARSGETATKVLIDVLRLNAAVEKEKKENDEREVQRREDIRIKRDEERRARREEERQRRESAAHNNNNDNEEKNNGDRDSVNDVENENRTEDRDVQLDEADHDIA